MSSMRFTTIQIKNTSNVPMEIHVTDPDGQDYFVTTLAAGAESTQFSPVGATWSLKLVAGSADAAASAGRAAPAAGGALDLKSGKGGDRAIP